MQPGQQGQREDDGRAGDTEGDGHDDPVVPRSGGDPLTGAGDGVTPPAEAPDALAALVGEGVVDEQTDAAGEAQAGEDEDSHPIGEVLGLPTGTLEEVVVAVEPVTLGVVRG